MQSYKIQVLENRTPNWNALFTNFQNDRDITSTRQSSKTVKLDTSLINLLTFPIFIYENMYQLSLISSHIHECHSEGMLILLCSFYLDEPHILIIYLSNHL